MIPKRGFRAHNKFFAHWGTSKMTIMVNKPIQEDRRLCISSILGVDRIMNDITRELLIMAPPLRGCHLSHPKSSFWKTGVPFISHCFQNLEFPWGANLSDFLGVFWRPKRKIFLAPTARFYPLEMIKIRFRFPKFSRAYGAILPFRNGQNTLQNPKIFRAPSARPSS